MWSEPGNSDLQTLHDFVMSLHVSRVSSVAPLWASTAANIFHFNADPDPSFDVDAKPEGGNRCTDLFSLGDRSIFFSLVYKYRFV